MLDFTQTQNPLSINRAFFAVPAPDWVRAEPIPTAEQFKSASRQAFADPERRLLPLTSKLTTFYSALDFYGNIGNYPAGVEDRVKQACVHYRIAGEILPYLDVLLQEQEKKAVKVVEEPESTLRFAIDEEHAGGPVRLLPINNPDEAAKSASDLAKMFGERRIHYITARRAALEIEKVAGEDSECLANLTPLLEYRLPNLDRAAEKIESRADYIPAHLDKGAAMNAYRGAIAAAARQEISLEECVEKIAALDHSLHIDLFDRRPEFLKPHEIVYSGITKLAAARAVKELVQVPDVTVIPLAAFKKIPRNQLLTTFGKAAADNFKSWVDTDDATLVSACLPSWSLEDRVSLTKLAIEHG